MPSSNTARSADRNNPLAVIMTSVAVIEFFGTGVKCSPAWARAV
jgi:predicted HTH transcriptional regulator